MIQAYMPVVTKVSWPNFNLTDTSLKPIIKYFIGVNHKIDNKKFIVKKFESLNFLAKIRKLFSIKSYKYA